MTSESEDFSDDDDSTIAATHGRKRTEAPSNQAYDYALELSESESIASDMHMAEQTRFKVDNPGRGRGDTPPKGTSDNEDSEDNYKTDEEEGLRGGSNIVRGSYPGNTGGGKSGLKNIGKDSHKGGRKNNNSAKSGKSGSKATSEDISEDDEDDGDGSNESSEDEEDEDEDEDDEDASEKPIEGAYNADDYKHLSVNEEIRELFQYISRYTPQTIELETSLKPFIPDFIPAVGDIDAFVKIPRHDNQPDILGLELLDEPSTAQSDPTVLDLQMRALSKMAGVGPQKVRSLNVKKDRKALEAWVTSIGDLHRSKPPPNVTYSRQMPEVDELMAAWPSEFEDMLRLTELPNVDLEVELKAFVSLLLGIMDIPVYKSSIESLHVLFTLFSAFKTSQHFKMQENEEASSCGRHSLKLSTPDQVAASQSQANLSLGSDEVR